MPEKNISIFKVFAETAKTYPAKKAILFKKDACEYTSLTYGQVYENAVKLGNLLRDIGIKPADKVSLILDNRPEYAIVFLAAMYTGATLVPLDIQLPAQQIQQFISHSGTKLLFTTEKIYSGLKKELSGLRVITVDSEEFQRQLIASKTDDNFNKETEEGRLALLVYTSGTTDLPKAVMLTHHNLLSNVNSIKELDIVRESDIIISMLPLHHTYPFTVTLLLPLLIGATIAYPGGISSLDLVSCSKETRATILVGVPQLFSLMHHSIKEKIEKIPFLQRKIINLLGDLSYGLSKFSGINLSKYIFAKIHKTIGKDLRFLISGGARLDTEVAEDFFIWGFTILEGYGLTETSPAATFNPPEKPKIGSVGKPIPNVEIKLIAPDKDGVGEVAIKGPNVMAGYYNMSRQTKEVIKDGWFFSGDLGYFDNDGYLFLTGRKKEIIVLSNGKNINPEEIEKLYLQSPFIKEACVLPVKEASFLKGVERLAAIIVINEEYFKLKNETNIRNKLKWEIENLSVKLPSYKRISGFVVSKEGLPRTRLGKIMRHKIDYLYAELLKRSQRKPEQVTQGAQDTPCSYTYEQAISFLRKTLKKDVSANDHLELDLGLDSLGRVELLIALQNRLNIKTSEEQSKELFMSNTVGELILKLEGFIPQDAEPTSQKDKAFIWKAILEEKPAQSTLRKINLKHSLFNIVISLILLSLFKVFFRIFFLLRAEGESNLKQNGPYLICSNHTSYLDGMVIASALPFKIAINAYFVGYSAIFEHFLLRGFIRMARLIPLEVNVNLIEALKACSYVLRNSKIVCLFPEGHRSINEEVEDFKKGVGILIKELDIPVVPAYIEGAFSAWPRYRTFPRLARITVRFGKMLSPDNLLPAGYAREEKEEVYKAIAGNLRNEVIKQKTPAYLIFG